MGTSPLCCEATAPMPPRPAADRAAPSPAPAHPHPHLHTCTCTCTLIAALRCSLCRSGLFIISPTGVLRQITVNDLPVGRSVDETLRLVRAFQVRARVHVRARASTGWQHAATSFRGMRAGLQLVLAVARPSMQVLIAVALDLHAAAFNAARRCCWPVNAMCACAFLHAPCSMAASRVQCRALPRSASSILTAQHGTAHLTKVCCLLSTPYQTDQTGC